MVVFGWDFRVGFFFPFFGCLVVVGLVVFPFVCGLQLKDAFPEVLGDLPHGGIAPQPGVAHDLIELLQLAEAWHVALPIAARVPVVGEGARR